MARDRREYMAAYQKKWKAKNREKVNAYAREYLRDYYAKNSEKMNAYWRDWRKANSDRCAAYQKTSRERVIEGAIRRKDVHMAKAIISEQTGIGFRDVPLDLALADAARLVLKREIRRRK